jgi:non-heme chloroperoxidase
LASEPINIFTEDSGGSGRPVILIHGWPLSGEAWKGQVPALTAAGYRVITYDRRGFGRSDKPASGYDYDTFASDLAGLIDSRNLSDVTLVGFSMGGGEVARYIANYGESKLRSVVFAAAVPPYLMQGPDNPEGPLTKQKAGEMEAGLKADRAAFFDGFTKDFFSANGELKVSEAQRQDAIALCQQSDQTAALGAMGAFGTTDFRDDLTKITVPTLVIHGDADAIVPLEGSGQRTHQAIPGSTLVVVPGAPHGFNVSHQDRFNSELLSFLER